MFISPIGINNSNNKFVNKSQKVAQTPTFKQQNYMKTFDSIYDRTIGSQGGHLVDQFFTKLCGAAANMKGAFCLNAYNSHMAQGGFYRVLGSLRGLFQDPMFESIAQEAKRRKTLPMVYISRKQPVVSVTDNGKFLDDNIISKSMRSRQKFDVERRCIEVDFKSLNDSRKISFSMDYDGDATITHMPNDNEIQKLQKFYSQNDRLKEMYDNVNKIKRYNMDGSEWTWWQWGVKDIEEEVRKTIRLYTGWSNL